MLPSFAPRPAEFRMEVNFSGVAPSRIFARVLGSGSDLSKGSSHQVLVPIMIVPCSCMHSGLPGLE